MALIRVPREYCQTIRASLTMLNDIQNECVAITTVSINGSARTAKISAIKQIQYCYRKKISSHINRYDKTDELIPKNTRKYIDRLCQSMEDSLEVITSIEY